MVDRPVGRHPARRRSARLPALRQRQGAGGRLEPARPGPDPPRADLHAAARAGGEVPDLSRRGAVPAAEHRVHRPEGGGRERHRQGLPDDPHHRAARRVRGRRRGDALEPLAGRAAAGDVRRDQPRGRRRARHQRRRLGLGLGAENSVKARVKALVTERVGKGVAFMPFHFGGWFKGEDLRGQLPAGHRPVRARRKRQLDHDLRLRPGHAACRRPKVTLCQIRAA